MAKGNAVAHPTGHGGHVHHLSPAPIIIGIGALVAYFGLASGLSDLAHGIITMGGGAIFLGALVFLAGIVVWIREDMGMWRDGYVDHGVLPGRDLGWWGMVFFLGTEVVLFGGLFAAFFVTRADVPGLWVELHKSGGALASALPLVTVNTLILISSGFTMHFLALHGIQTNDRKRFLWGMVVTIALGAIFLIVQMNEYSHLIKEGILLNSNEPLAGGTIGQFGSVF